MARQRTIQPPPCTRYLATSPCTWPFERVRCTEPAGARKGPRGDGSEARVESCSSGGWWWWWWLVVGGGEGSGGWWWWDRGGWVVVVMVAMGDGRLVVCMCVHVRARRRVCVCVCVGGGGSNPPFSAGGETEEILAGPCPRVCPTARAAAPPCRACRCRGTRALVRETPAAGGRKGSRAVRPVVLPITVQQRSRGGQFAFAYSSARAPHGVYV